MDTDTAIELSERVAVLETKYDLIDKKMTSIETKLDDLLHLKSKGTGALQLAGLILGSGILGFVVMLWQVFQPKNHL